MVKAHADPNASNADDTLLICSTCDHQPRSTEKLLRLDAKPNLAANRSDLTALHVVVTDNQEMIIQQLLSHDAERPPKAETEQSILHLTAFHGDNVTMDILSRTRLVEVDPDARDALGKPARHCFEERCGECLPDAGKNA